MARWDENSDLVEMLSQSTELSILRLKRTEILDDDDEGERKPETWSIGIDGATSVVKIRETAEGIDVGIDWFSLSAKALGDLQDDPKAYVAGSAGIGMTVGAMLGRSGTAAVAGAAVGCLLGLLSQAKGRR